MARKRKSFTARDVVRIFKTSLAHKEQLTVLAYFFSLIPIRTNKLAPFEVIGKVLAVIPALKTISGFYALGLELVSDIDVLIQHFGLSKTPFSIRGQEFELTQLTLALENARIDLSACLVDKLNLGVGHEALIQELHDKDLEIAELRAIPPQIVEVVREVPVEKLVFIEIPVEVPVPFDNPQLLQERNTCLTEKEALERDSGVQARRYADLFNRTVFIRDTLVAIIHHNDPIRGSGYPAELTPIPPEIGDRVRFINILLAI